MVCTEFHATFISAINVHISHSVLHFNYLYTILFINKSFIIKNRMKESNINCNDNSNDVQEQTREVLSLLALSKEPQQQQFPQFQQSIISTVDYRVHFANLTKLDLFQANLDPNIKILFCMKNNFKVMLFALSKFPI